VNLREAFQAEGLNISEKEEMLIHRIAVQLKGMMKLMNEYVVHYDNLSVVHAMILTILEEEMGEDVAKQVFEQWKAGVQEEVH
jgi:hypothetical protein